MTTAEDIQSILQREANAILNIPISDAFEKAISNNAVPVDKTSAKRCAGSLFFAEDPRPPGSQKKRTPHNLPNGKGSKMPVSHPV